jgi:hypothetical protein
MKYIFICCRFRILSWMPGLCPGTIDQPESGNPEHRRLAERTDLPCPAFEFPVNPFQKIRGQDLFLRTPE